MVRDCLATSFPHVVVGILLHMRTCMPRFYIPVTARPIVFKLSVRLGPAWATTALPCIFRKHGQIVSAPGRDVRYFFLSVWNRAHLPGTSNRPLPPTRTTSRLIPASSGTARPWAMEPRRPGAPPVMPSTRCLGWRAARPTDPVEIARVAGLRLTRSHACERKTQNTWFG